MTARPPQGAVLAARNTPNSWNGSLPGRARTGNSHPDFCLVVHSLKG